MTTTAAMITAVLFAGPAAASGLSFESRLSRLRESFQAQRTDRHAVMRTGAARELGELAFEARTIAGEIPSLRERIQELRRRALTAPQPYPPRRPYPPQPVPPQPYPPRYPYPPYPQDPWLRHELDRLISDIGELASRASNAEGRAFVLAHQVQKDPELVTPAQQLVADAGALAEETARLERDARSAGWELRRAGLTGESIALENRCADLGREAENLQSWSKRILERVQ